MNPGSTVIYTMINGKRIYATVQWDHGDSISLFVGKSYGRSQYVILYGDERSKIEEVQSEQAPETNQG